MCVRKTADTGGTPTMQGSSLTSSTCSTSTAKSSRRHKPLKAMRSRGGAGGAKQPETTTATEKKQPSTTVEVDCTVKIRDDGDGHLIYHKGDLVDQRCKFAKSLARGISCSPLASYQNSLPLAPWV